MADAAIVKLSLTLIFWSQQHIFVQYLASMSELKISQKQFYVQPLLINRSLSRCRIVTDLQAINPHRTAT